MILWRDTVFSNTLLREMAPNFIGANQLLPFNNISGFTERIFPSSLSVRLYGGILKNKLISGKNFMAYNTADLMPLYNEDLYYSDVYTFQNTVDNIYSHPINSLGDNKTYIIAGNNLDTINGIDYIFKTTSSKDYYDINSINEIAEITAIPNLYRGTKSVDNVYFDNGDGTVPLSSATLGWMPSNGEVYSTGAYAGFVNYHDYNFRVYSGISHQDLAKDDNVIDEIINIIDGNPTNAASSLNAYNLEGV